MDNYGYEPDSEDEDGQSGDDQETGSDDDGPGCFPDLGRILINPYRYF